MIVTILSPIALVALAGTALALTARRWRRLLRQMRQARRPDSRGGDIRGRLRALLVDVLGQGRLLRWPYAGALHALIFWGFLVLLTAIAQAVAEAADVGVRLDTIPVAAPVLAYLQDIFAVLALTGVALALVNRLVVRPGRFRGSHGGDALLILGWIAALLLCLELNYATLIAEHSAEALGADRPFAAALSHLFAGLGSGSAALIALHGAFFWAHLLLVFGFLVYLGYSKHLHIVTAPVNVFLREQGPKGRMRPLDIEAVMSATEASARHFGAGALDDLSWKDMLDLHTCTECGRCQSHCPAYLTGKPLSPKTLITDLRDAARERLEGGYAATRHGAHVVEGTGDARGADRAGGSDDGGADRAGSSDAGVAWGAGTGGAMMWAAGGRGRDAVHDIPGSFQPSWLSPEQVSAAVTGAGGGERPLIGGVIAEQTLWACTMCGACMDQCPVFIEHVPKIAEMRRHLVLDDSRLPRAAETALRAIESVANPYGASPPSRVDWTAGLDVPLLGDHPHAEYLYWVGCAASFDERARGIAIAMVDILRTAGVDFAILGAEEGCTGDPARRIGNEYLFQERARQNIGVLAGHGVRRIVTACPHCFNTLANEYPVLGGHYQVIHHSELIATLIGDGRIVLERPLDATVTYHDSCYLGRWNGVYDPPRDILARIPGVRLVEMRRSRREGMCCGAGGGRMWMEEDQPRINHRRAGQAAETGATRVATACPFCLTMFDEGIGALRAEEAIAVDDIAVYVARSMRRAGGAGAAGTGPSTSG
jgi:Fe-S oxidoreductase/nitrate reductase gamma subunit